MNSPGSTMADVHPRSNRTARRIAWGLVTVLIAGIGVWTYVTLTARFRLIADIRAAGGQYAGPGLAAFLELPFARLAGQKTRHFAHIELVGSKFDDAWLADHDDLRGIAASHLVMHDTQLSREAVLRILAHQSLSVLDSRGIPLTDADAAVLGRQPDILNMNLPQSDITDAGLTALRPQRLVVLNVAGTRVTAGALTKELAASQLQILAVDGRQFTPELAAQLAQLTSLRGIALIGPDVTDAHVEQLESMSTLKIFALDQTSASDAAIARLRAAHPGARITLLDAQSSSYKWRADRDAAGESSHD